MKLQDQVCSLEQTKKLKELGVIADSVCSHVIHSDREPFVEYTSCMVEIHGWGNKEGSYSMPAYTVAELGVMLPEFSYSWRGRGLNDQNYACVTSDQPPSDDEIDYLIDKCEVAIKKTEAQARAAKLIQKIESGELSAAEVNQRLQAA